MEHDGRNLHHESSEGVILLCVYQFPARYGSLSVRPHLAMVIHTRLTRITTSPLRTEPKSNGIVQEYILPDFSLNRPGRIRQPGEPPGESSQILYMNNERFTVPEIIFRPDDIGTPGLCIHVKSL